MGLPDNTTQKTGQPEASVSNRDAVIFIPGLRHEPGEVIREVSQAIGAALDKQARTDAATFLLKKEGKTEDYHEHKAAMATIARKDREGEQETPLLDIYEMSYKRTLTKEIENRKPIVQALLIGWLLILDSPRAFKAFRKRGKTFSEKLQVVYAGGIVTLIVSYMLILLVTAAATLGEVLSAQRGSVFGNMSNPGFEFIGTVFDYLLPYLKSLVVISAAFGLFTWGSVKQIVSEASIWFVSAGRYLSTGYGRSILTGQLYALLEHVSEKGVRYRKIHIIAYSFGSVLALDALFPDDVPSRRTRVVDTLITIGCPFDYIRTFYGEYFSYRETSDGAPREWFNVYVAADVLASNFKNQGGERSRSKEQDKPHPGEQGIKLKGGSEVTPNDNVLYGSGKNLEDYKLLEKAALIGFQLHNSYWTEKEPYAPNCFDLIVQRIYDKNDYALS